MEHLVKKNQLESRRAGKELQL
jgi:hypothetical protein